jgi:CRP-like cAMP-binding protein
LYIIAEGEVSILIKQSNGAEQEVDRKGKNEILGENSFLTGEPRSATVRSLGESLLCRISKNVLKPILLNRPEIMEDLSQMLAQRELENERKSKEFDEKTMVQKKESSAKKFLDLIKGFFKEDEEEIVSKVKKR